MSGDPFDYQPGPDRFTFDPGDFEFYTAQADEDEHAAHSEPEDPNFVQVDPDTEKPLDPQEVRAFLRLYVLQRVVNDAIGDFIGTRKESADVVLEAAAKQLGSSQFTVSVPTIEDIEEDIAKVSVKKSKPKTTVASEDEFTAWLTKNYPDLVEVEHVPEKTVVVEAHDETRVKTNALAVVTKDATFTKDGQVVSANGEPIPGLRHVPGGEYDGHSVTWLGTGSPGKKKALRLLVTDSIKAISAGDVIAAAALEKGQQ